MWMSDNFNKGNAVSPKNHLTNDRLREHTGTKLTNYNDDM